MVGSRGGGVMEDEAGPHTLDAQNLIPSDTLSD